MVPAASVFLVVSLGYAVWCLVVAFDSGFTIGSLGMLLLSVALLYEGLALLQRSRPARLLGIVTATALAIGCIATAALVTLPWLSTTDDTTIPSTLWPTLGVLLSTGAAFAVAAALLVYDRRDRGH